MLRRNSVILENLEKVIVKFPAKPDMFVEGVLFVSLHDAEVEFKQTVPSWSEEASWIDGATLS